MGEPDHWSAADTLSGSMDVQLVPPPSVDGVRYRDQGLLGVGGVGVVSLRFDRCIGRRVAVKELRPVLAGNEHIRARFLREAQVQGQLEHPAVVPVYDLGVDADGAPFFTMKSVQGTTLYDILERLRAGDADAAARFSRHRLLAAFAGVCLAIDYAHQRGILHRDLKPGNIMLGEFGEVYVLDWGLAKIRGLSDASLLGGVAAVVPPGTRTGAVTEVGALLGTPGYMAPEQVEDASNIDEPADVYALGAILFEVLTLEPLHGRGSMMALLESTREPADARPSMRAPDRHVDPELEAVCVAATALDPAARTRSARDLHDAVQRYLEGERDLDMRRARAAAHADAAAAAATRAVRADAPLRERRTAMREIGRALALDPGNASAVKTMVALLTEAPARTPPEVEFELEKAYRNESRWIGGVGALVYPAILAFLPVMFWMGVRQPLVIAAFFVLLLVCSVLSVLVHRSAIPPLGAIVTSMFASSIAFGFCARFGSPLILAPTALAVNGAAYAIFLPRKLRPAVAIAASLAILVPLLLELTGVLPRTLVFTDGKMVLVPQALALPESATMALVVMASVVAITIAIVVVGYIRDRLWAAERRMYLYTWHLRELVPSEARPATDPTA
jgi:eukaryotic-like serine/threonine-protein kinase